MTRILSLMFAGCVALSVGLSAQANDGDARNHTSELIVQLATIPELSIFTDMLLASGLADELALDGHLAIFAPNDAAFKALPSDLLDRLRDGNDTDQLRQLIKLHIAQTPVKTGDMEFAFAHADSQLQTGSNVAAAPVSLAAMHQDYHINLHQIAGTIQVTTSGRGDAMAEVTLADIAAGNGYIHVISRVLTP